MESQDEAPDNIISFGRYRVFVRERQFSRSGDRLEIGDRAFDVLLALIESRGQPLSKQDLMLQAWSGRAVGENALQAQIASLRRVLGVDRDLVLTVSGRGYQFTGQVSYGAVEPPGAASAMPAALPARRADFIGRTRELDELAALAQAQRFVTIVGCGGVGKTVLALELAWRLAPWFDGAVRVANLSDCADAAAAHASIDAAQRDLPPAAPVPIAAPARHLLLLDGCERWLDVAAERAERALREDVSLHLLATSRESIRGDGESSYRLSGFAAALEAAPDRGPAGGAAVDMFLARHAAAGNAVAIDAAFLAAVGRICDALDGLPLAIDMAAVRAAGVGVDWVQTHADEAVAWLTHGARNAPERHRSMRACLAWSCDALSPQQRWMLKRASEFARPFTLAEACALLTADRVEASDVLDRLSDLVGKSLIEWRGAPGGFDYQLLRLTRLYAAQADWSRA
jgi:predicted ATPase/DNA-binding winged helix-turn-helix (wHTH) protein